MTNKPNLEELNPYLFKVYTQAGYRKLLKKFNIHYRPHDERWNRAEIYHYNYGNLEVTYDIDTDEGVHKRFKNYPVKYPVWITVNDKSFERCSITLYINYNI